MCMAFVTAHMAWALGVGPSEWAEQAFKSHEYHACLFVHQCFPEKVVDTVRAAQGCTEHVIGPGTPTERRMVR